MSMDSPTTVGKVTNTTIVDIDDPRLTSVAPSSTPSESEGSGGLQGGSNDATPSTSSGGNEANEGSTATTSTSSGGNEANEGSTATTTTSSRGNEANGIDPSALSSMERLFFSIAGGGGFVIIMNGYGLMMVDPEKFELFYVQGLVLAALGLVFILFSWLIHICRLRSLSRNEKLHGRSIYISTIWTGGLVLLFLLCVGLELHYAKEHPYMKRSMPVDVNNPESNLVPQPHTATRPPAIEPQPQGHHQQGGIRRLAQDAGTIFI